MYNYYVDTEKKVLEWINKKGLNFKSCDLWDVYDEITEDDDFFENFTINTNELELKQRIFIDNYDLMVRMFSESCCDTSFLYDVILDKNLECIDIMIRRYILTEVIDKISKY